MIKPEIAFVNTHVSEGKTSRLIISAYRGDLFLTYKVIGPGDSYHQINYRIRIESDQEIMAFIDAIEEAETGTDMQDVINEFYYSLLRVDL